MRIYNWSNGFYLQRDADDEPIAIGPAVAQFGVPDQDLTLRYQILPDQEPEDLPEVDLLDIGPFFIDVATGTGFAGADWLPVPADAEIRIGRVTLQGPGTTHDLIEFELPGTNSSFLFLLDGDPLDGLAHATVEELEALQPVAGAVPPGQPTSAGQVIALDTLVPDLAFNPATSPQIIRAGRVVEDPEHGFNEIGTFRGMDGAGDGSVTVLGGASWALPTDTNYNQIYVGGWGADGAVTVIGTGSEAVWQAGNDPDTRLDAQIGVDGGTGRIDILDGGYWEVADAINSPASRGDLSFGIMDGTAEVRIDNSRFDYFGFDTAYLTLGNGTFTLSNDAGATMSARDAARIYIGDDTYDDQSGTLAISGGSRFHAFRLDELHIGAGGGTGFVTLDSGVLSGDLGPDRDVMMWVQIGADGGTGVVEARNLSELVFANDYVQTRDSTDFLMQVGTGTGMIWDPGSGDMVATPGHGDLRIYSDSNATIVGFGTTRIEVGTEGGEGRIDLVGGSLDVYSSAETTMMVGNGTGNGRVNVENGGRVNLGGDATVQIGGIRTDDMPGWAAGELAVMGNTSLFTGFAQMQVGTPLAQTDPTVTPRGFGTVSITNATVGNAGATLDFGVMSELNLWGFASGTARIHGDVNLGGGAVMMGEMGGSRAVIDGNLTVAEGFNWLRMTITEDWQTGARQVDRLDITGELNLADGELQMVFDPAWGYEFGAGERHDLITFGQLVDGDADFDVTLGHHIFHPEFAWMFQIDQAQDGTLSFHALTEMDGTGTATLDFGQGDTALEMTASDTGDIGFMGGGLYGGIAHNIEVIYATTLDDSIDLTGYTRAVQIYGGSGDDTIIGGAGDDTLMGGSGDDVIDGGAGFNTALFSGNRSDYEVRGNGDSIRVTDLREGSPDGTDMLTNIQRLFFLGDGSSEDITPPTVTLAGAVTSRYGPLADTAVTFTPAEGDPASHTTGADGLFGLEIAAGMAGHLDATREVTAGDPGFTIASALNTLRLALGIQPAWGPASASDLIAADFNGDGAVTTADVFGILRGALQLATPNELRWVFIDSDADLSGISRHDVSYSTGIDLAGLDADLAGLSLTGILIGHVEGVLPG